MQKVAPEGVEMTSAKVEKSQSQRAKETSEKVVRSLKAGRSQIWLTILYHVVNFGTLVWTAILVADLNRSPKNNPYQGIANLQRCADYMIDDSEIRFSGRGWVYMAFAFSIFFILPYFIQLFFNLVRRHHGDKKKQSRLELAFYGLMGISDPEHQVRQNALAGNFIMLCVFIFTSVLGLRSLNSIPCSDDSFWSSKDVINTNSPYFTNPASYSGDGHLLAGVPTNASSEFWWFKHYFIYQLFTSVIVSFLVIGDLYWHHHLGNAPVTPVSKSEWTRKILTEGRKEYEKIPKGQTTSIKGSKESRFFVPELEDGLSNRGNKFRF